MTKEYRLMVYHDYSTSVIDCDTAEEAFIKLEEWKTTYIEDDLHVPLMEVVKVIVPPKQPCPECGDTEHYRIIYTDDEMNDVKFYDCMMCHTHWDTDGKNLGKY